MDKTNSFRCVKCALVAGNTAVIALGLTGFIIGLVTPNVLFKYDPYNVPYNYGVTGSQVALVSSIAVLVAAVGLIGALKEHFYLLLVYILCLLGAFLFRLCWSLTTHLHFGERFIMDITISLTLLSSLAKLFLLIFAILEAFTIQNSLPLTKQKFLMLKSMLKPKPKKAKTKKYSKPKPVIKVKNNHSDSNIYATSSSIYGSGRRRSPSRMNGQHHQHQHHYATQPSRARKYLPDVEYNQSPNSSHSSNDTNNNQKATNKDVESGKLKQQQPLPPQPINDTVDQSQWHPKKLLNQHYYHFQGPTPLTPTSEVSQFTNQPFFSYKTPNRSSVSKVTQSNIKTIPSSKESETPVKASHQSKPVYAQRPTSPLASDNRASTLISAKSPPLSSRTTTSSSVSKPSSYTSPKTPPPIPNSYAKYASYTSPRSTPTSVYSKTLSYTSPSSTPTSNSYEKNLKYTSTNTSTIGKSTTPRQYASSPSIVTTTTTNTPPAVSRSTSIFTTPSSSKPANLFNYASVYGGRDSGNPVTMPSTQATNLSQTRNLFSTFTSPYSEQSKSTLYSQDTSQTSSPLSQLKSPISSPISSPTYGHRDPVKSTSVSQYRPTTYTSPITTSASNLFAATTPTSSSSATTLMARLYPKSYEDYIKSYRYPGDTATPTNENLSMIKARPPEQDSGKGGKYFTNTVAGFNRQDGNTSTTTIVSTTTQHHERTEHQKQSIFYQQIIRDN